MIDLLPPLITLENKALYFFKIDLVTAISISCKTGLFIHDQIDQVYETSVYFTRCNRDLRLSYNLVKHVSIYFKGRQYSSARNAITRV